MDSHIKEGFLVKKSSLRHKWKSRWFVLHEDRLSYYKKKDRKTSRGALYLRGASVTYPVPEYEKKKRKNVFKICRWDGKDYYLQAPNEQERELWCHSIGATIRSPDSTVQQGNKRATFSASNVNLSEVLGASQDPDAGIPRVTKEVDGVEYNQCFSGASAVEWLITWSFAESREVGISMCEELLKLAHIQPLKPKKDSDVDKYTFIDSDIAFYRYSYMHPSGSQEFLLSDSSSQSSSSEEGEMSEGDMLDKVTTAPKGKALLDGFLLKRGYHRNKWKNRKVILRENPASIEYYSASKDSKDLLKRLSLQDAVACDIKDHMDLASSVSKRRKHVFCVRWAGKNVKPLLFQAEDEYQKKQWMEAVENVAKPDQE